MPDFRKITAVTGSSKKLYVTVMLLDYDDLINTLKVINNNDPYNLLHRIIKEVRRYKEDPSTFCPCSYVDGIPMEAAGFDGVYCDARQEKITEDEFNNPPDKWKNARRVEIRIVYDDVED